MTNSCIIFRKKVCSALQR